MCSFCLGYKGNNQKILFKSDKVNVNATKLVKAGLPKQLVEEVLQEMFEVRNC